MQRHRQLVGQERSAFCLLTEKFTGHQICVQPVAFESGSFSLSKGPLPTLHIGLIPLHMGLAWGLSSSPLSAAHFCRNENDTNTAWATLLALAFLHLFCQDKKKQWTLLQLKAEAWLKRFMSRKHAGKKRKDEFLADAKKTLQSTL